MSSIVNKVWNNVIEKPLASVGLMDYPTLRFTAFTVVTYAALKYSKPKGMFNQEGKERSTKLLNPMDDEAVIVNAKLCALIVGIASVILI